MSFFDACSLIFKNIKEYFKVFLAHLIVIFIGGLLGVIPLIGFVMQVLAFYYSLFIIPTGIYMTRTQENVDFIKIFELSFETCCHPSKEVIKQVIKIFIATILIIIICSVFIIFIIFGILGISTIDSNEMSITYAFAFGGTLFVIFALVFMVIYLLLLKMTTKLTFVILSMLMDDRECLFLEKNKSLFTYDFLWNAVPLLNIISNYAIATRFIEIYKSEQYNNIY